ncbi:putative MscS family protein [Lachnellula subtilissima]|uniref:Mechanosensitive ion channel protein n=1 Tax=Lachnellula subtilissima TaxID=602034 RepID=A0A8H8RLF8_9HELO|nr:putative MscS family protein [Lachnellula subtilissima]
MPQEPASELPLTEYPAANPSSSPYSPPAQQPSLRARISQSTSSRNESPPSTEKASFAKLGGRRRRNGVTSTAPQEEQDDLNKFGKLYEKILTYGTGTRYSIYILPVALILAIPVIVGATQVSDDPKKDPKIGGVRVVWFFTWFEAVWLTLWAMTFVARIIPGIFGFFAGVVSSETRKYKRVLENLQGMITIFGWVVISFVLYEILFSTSADGNTPDSWTSVFKKVLGAILVATIIFFIEKVLVQLISVSYHSRSYNNRIGESKRYVYLLGILFEASRKLFPMFGPEFRDEDNIMHNIMGAFVKIGRGDSKHSHRIFNGMGRFNNKMNSVFGDIATELKGRSVLPERSAESIVSESLGKTATAQALARRLWLSFVAEGKEVLHLSDLEEVLGEGNEDVAKQCFLMLDPDENTDVTLEETALRVKEIASDRKAIEKSMHDVSQAIKALDNVLASVAFLLSIFALICFLDTGFHSILSTASTTLLSLSFVFSVTAQEFLGSCIFLFVKHPYDISDRVDISGPDGINSLVVEQISLLYTSFKRIKDLELIQIPNSVLNTLWINNISRSKSLLERIDIYISFDTSFEDMNALRLEMQKFVSGPENKREWQEDVMLRCLGVGSMDKLQLQLEVRHKSNWSVEHIRAARHSKLMCALVLALRKIPIFAPGGGAAALGDPTNPAYSVAVSDEVAVAARNKAAVDLDAARLTPLSKPNSGNAQLPTERVVDEATNYTPSPATQATAANAMKMAQLGESLRDPADDDSRDGQDLQKIPSPSGIAPEASNIQSSESLRLQTTKSPQGRRRAGSSAPPQVTTTSQQDPQALELVPSFGEA